MRTSAEHKFIITLSGPSGSGKSTIEDRLISNGITQRVLGFTTREPRDGEKDGVDVNFKSFAEGKALYESGTLAQWLAYNGNFYGKTREEVLAGLETSKAVSCVIEPSGVEQLQEFARREGNITVLPYFVTADTDVLTARMLERFARDSEPDNAYNARRMRSLLEKEIHWGSEYSFRDVLINDNRADIRNNLQTIISDINNVGCAHLR